MEDLSQSVEALNVELTETENKAYMEWRVLNKPPIPLATALKLYELFLNFYSLDDIYRINGKKLHLGAIVACRLDQKWDQRRKEQLDSMYSTIEQKVVKVKNEAVVHLTDLLSAAHKIWGDKIKLFLQEGDPAILEDLNIVNFKNYKELIQLLKELTDKQNQPAVSKLVVDHTHTIKDSPKQMSSGVAADLLKLLKDKDAVNG